MLAVITVIERPDATNTPLALRFGTLIIYVLAMLFLIRPGLRRWVPAASPPR